MVFNGSADLQFIGNVTGLSLVHGVNYTVTVVARNSVGASETFTGTVFVPCEWVLTMVCGVYDQRETPKSACLYHSNSTWDTKYPPPFRAPLIILGSQSRMWPLLATNNSIWCSCEARDHRRRNLLHIMCPPVSCAPESHDPTGRPPGQLTWVNTLPVNPHLIDLP